MASNNGLLSDTGGGLADGPEGSGPTDNTPIQEIQVEMAIIRDLLITLNSIEFE